MNATPPNWSPERIISESVSAWNRRHPDNLCHEVTSEWNFVVNVVHSWVRHYFTDYERLVTPENHDGLKNKISAEVARAYPWLNRDPRSSFAEKSKDLAFAEASRELSELSAKRSDCMLALAKLRRAQPVDRKAIAKLTAEVNQADQRIQKLCSYVKPDQYGDRHLYIDHKSGDYFWGGRELSPNYLEPVPQRIRCKACDAVIWRTKRAVDCGAGVKNVIFSCHCRTTFGSDGNYDERWWLGPESQERANGVKQMRAYLKRIGLNPRAVDSYLHEMIHEGTAVWDDALKTMTVDRRAQGLRAYRLKFSDDGTLQRMALEEEGGEVLDIHHKGRQKRIVRRQPRKPDREGSDNSENVPDQPMI